MENVLKESDLEKLYRYILLNKEKIEYGHTSDGDNSSNISLFSGATNTTLDSSIGTPVTYETVLAMKHAILNKLENLKNEITTNLESLNTIYCICENDTHTHT